MTGFESTPALLAHVDAAVIDGQLTAEAAKNLKIWLTEARYSAYVPAISQHIEQAKWLALDDAFWTVIPFGTGGRRGKMYPFGSNTINDRTIGESAQGLADYVLANPPAGAELSCAIAYDTRHRSRQFAELCAGIMAAAGFKICFLDGYRSTPELSFAVRFHRCACGIMVTASHNPPSDNAVKVYWSTGGQVLPPHDKGIIEGVMGCGEIRVMPFADAVAAGKVVMCEKETDTAYIAAVAGQALPGARNVKILYSPLHGVGASAVSPALAADGFNDVELFGPQANPDGDFPNVPGHVSNPENPAVFDSIIAQGKTTGVELILASDPDCDRLGCAAPLTLKSTDWGTFTGNQIGALLTEYVLAARRKTGSLTPQHYVVKTLVTTEMIRRIADAYGVRTEGDLQVGFKYIGQMMDQAGPEKFVFGAEESHGYLVGSYARDKDAAVAAMLLSELAAVCKQNNQSLHEKLDALYWQYGYHCERTVSVTMPGSQGMKDMLTVMARFRATPPETLAGIAVAAIRDYASGTSTHPGQLPQPMGGSRGDMVILDLAADGNYVAVRPSGTEPKIKFYMFTFEPAEQLHSLDDAKRDMGQRLTQMHQELAKFAGI